MPELPEVEAARTLLERGCVGKRIVKVVAANDDKVFEGATPGDVQRALEGRRVVSARRKGKYMWLELDNPEGPWPLLHFGMTGGIVVRKMGFSKYKRVHLESDPDEWPPRFTKLEMDMEGGATLAFVDARRFARVKLLKDPPSQEPISKLGFDVMDELPGPEAFMAAVRKRVARAPALKIKALLLDQEFCSGIGNWVGDEVLYQARIHPEQPATSLDDAALSALHGAIRAVIELSVEVEADSDRFPKDWLFHYRWTNKKPSSINGHKIEFVTVGSRTSAFVPALQKLTGKAGGGGGSRGGGDGDGGGDGGKAKTRGGARKRGRGAAKKKSGSDGEGEEEEEQDEEEEEESDSEVHVAKAPAKRSRGAAVRKAAAAATRRKGGAGAKRGGKRKRRSDSDSGDADDDDDDDDDDDEAQEDDAGDGGDEQEEEEEDEDTPPAKKRSRAKQPAAAAKSKKGSGSAAGPRRQAPARGRRKAAV